MNLRTLRLISFRAHDRTECEFTRSVNLIYGPNGAGKTNLLEAIHFLCLSKGFVTSQDRYVVRKGARHLEIEGHFQRGDGRNVRIRMAYVPGEGKKIFVNGAPIDRLSDIVGQVPVVVYSPQDHVLTAGGPEERRRLIDNILSQASPLYLDNLLRYRRTLKQRNSLLFRLQEQRGAFATAALEPWDVELVNLGSRIIASRAEFAREFSDYLERAYREIEFVAERPTLNYDTITNGVQSTEPREIAESFRKALEESSARERRRGLTLVGPHRDDLVFRLDSLLVRRYASQGQHRTFGMALKLAKYFYLQHRTGETPILLLDDVFDHLDRNRTKAFLDLLRSDRIGQALITAADPERFLDFVSFSDAENSQLRVEAGSVIGAGPKTSEVSL